MRANLLLSLVLLGSVALGASAHAQEHGLAAEFDWQTEWGKLPDNKILARAHGLKSAINNAVNRCGIGKTNYELIKTYRVSLSNITAYLIDPSAYFAQGQQANCDSKPCSGSDGCMLTVAGPETTGTVSEACATGTCTTTVYNYPLINERYVLGWSVMSAADFLVIREARKDRDGRYKYKLPADSSNILTARLSNSSGLCTVDERDVNNDGQATADEPCVKYYQDNSGIMVDLYAPDAPLDVVENDLRFQPDATYARWYDVNDHQGTSGGAAQDAGHYLAYKRFGAAVATGPDAQGQYTSKQGSDVYDFSWREGQTSNVGDRSLGSNHLAAGKTEAYQLINFYIDQGKPTERQVALICDQYTNSGSKDVFVPTATDDEYQRFRDAAAASTVPGVSVKECDRNYTRWVGQTACPADIPCRTTITISALRKCQRASSAYGQCTNDANECAASADPQPLAAGGMVTPCFFQRRCVNPECPPTGTDCLAASTLVLMSDGAFKSLEDLKVGDMVMAFSKKAPLAPLVPSKIKEIRVTSRSELQRGLYEVNGIPLTSGHRVLVGHGKSVVAGSLKKGQKLVGLSGDPVEVKQARRAEGKSEKVYSVVLEGADGFVVNGVRILGR